MNEPQKPAVAAKPLPSLILACVTFFALGMLTAAIGPALSDLADNAGAALAAVGSIYTGLFLGSLIAQSAAGPVQDRFGPRPVLLVGMILGGLGTLSLTFAPSLALIFAIAAITGFGHGAVDVTVNVMVGELYPTRRATVLNLVNVFFGIGAFVGPAVAGLTLRLYDTALPSLWLAGGLMLLLTPAMALYAPPAAIPMAEGDHATHDRASVLRSPMLWLFGAMMLIYVGIENGTGGWTPTYLERTAGMAAAGAALVTSAFWMAISIGRVIATLLGVRLSSRGLLGAALGTALLGAGLIGASQGSAAFTTAGVVLMGIGFGPIFPTTVAIITAHFRGSSGLAAGLIVAMGGLGGMIVPWLQGQLLANLGPSASQALTVLCAVAMLVFFFLTRKITPQPSA